MEERKRFEAEEKEWRVRQRQYFGSFAASIFEQQFDKINNISSDIISVKNLKNVFSGIRFYENFSLTNVSEFLHTNWVFPKISEKFSWQEEGVMMVLVLLVYSKEYAYFVLFSEWIKHICVESFQSAGEIYDIDHFNAYENEYIL